MARARVLFAKRHFRSRPAPGGGAANVTWEGVPTRSYIIQKRLDLNPDFSWFDSGLGLIASDGLSTLRTVLDSNAPIRFYRVQAVRPLGP
jgi:hypothetical protein